MGVSVRLPSTLVGRPLGPKAHVEPNCTPVALPFTYVYALGGCTNTLLHAGPYGATHALAVLSYTHGDGQEPAPGLSVNTFENEEPAGRGEGGGHSG